MLISDLEARLVLPADTNKLDELFAFIREKLEKVGCPEMIQTQIELAAEEIFVNIVRYAYKDGNSGRSEDGENERAIPYGSCEITMMVTSGSETGDGRTAMTLRFTDQGNPFNPLEHMDPDISSRLMERKTGGLGILIVKRIMDMVEYSYDGMNHLLIKKIW